MTAHWTTGQLWLAISALIWVACYAFERLVLRRRRRKARPLPAVDLSGRQRRQAATHDLYR